MRLMVAGYRLGVRLDTFVHHLKSKSFGSEKKKEDSRKGRETLAKLYGVEFLPAYAEVLDRNSTLAGVRFAVAAALEKQLPMREVTLEPGASVRFVRPSESTDIIRLIGPMSAVVWPDLVETYDAEAVPDIELEIGAAYLHVTIPPSQSLAFASTNPIRSLLGVCGVRSSFAAVHVEMNPAVARSADISAAIRELSFRHLYLDHAPVALPHAQAPTRPRIAAPAESS
jgi:hypothetical protein